MSADRLLAAGWDPNKVIISFEGVDYVEKVFELVRTQQLRPDITLCGLWPTENGRVTDPHTWTKREWEDIKRLEDRVLAEASKV
jgi:hypothetical protein